MVKRIFLVSVVAFLIQACSSGVVWEMPLNKLSEPLRIDTSRSNVSFGQFAYQGINDLREQERVSGVLLDTINELNIDIERAVLAGLFESMTNDERFLLSNTDGIPLRIDLTLYGYASYPFIGRRFYDGALYPFFLSDIKAVDQQGKVLWAVRCYQSMLEYDLKPPNLKAMFKTPALAEDAWKALALRAGKAILGKGCKAYGAVR